MARPSVRSAAQVVKNVHAILLARFEMQDKLAPRKTRYRRRAGFTGLCRIKEGFVLDSIVSILLILSR